MMVSKIIDDFLPAGNDEYIKLIFEKVDRTITTGASRIDPDLRFLGA